MGMTAFTPASDTMATVQPTSETANNFDERPGGEELSWGSEMSSGQGSRDPNDESDTDAGEIQAAATSLRDHLNMQLALTQMEPRARALVAFLIEALDEDGYLAPGLEELADVLPDGLGEDREELLEELAIALRHLQNFDPPGIGARSPRECLELQLANVAPSACRELAHAIALSRPARGRDFARIKKARNCARHALIRP
jgi:RNA polymerase sigma-54 factor